MLAEVYLSHQFSAAVHGVFEDTAIRSSASSRVLRLRGTWTGRAARAL